MHEHATQAYKRAESDEDATLGDQGWEIRVRTSSWGGSQATTIRTHELHARPN
jgi:hypothetical protein